MTDVILVIPFGANDTPIAHGTIDYQPHAYRADISDPNSPWLVKVPAHHAAHFIHNAGFYPMQKETEPQFSGTARLYAPYGCSWGGVQYHPDMNDIVVVPAAAVVDLLAFPPICPETSRPEPEAETHVERTADLISEMSAKLIERDHHIAELKSQIHARDPAWGGAEPKAKSAKS